MSKARARRLDPATDAARIALITEHLGPFSPPDLAAGWRSYTAHTPQDTIVTVIVRANGEIAFYLVGDGTPQERATLAAEIANTGTLPRADDEPSLVDQMLAAARLYADSEAGSITTNPEARSRAKKALVAAVLSGASLTARYLLRTDGSDTITPAAIEKAAHEAAKRLGMNPERL